MNVQLPNHMDKAAFLAWAEGRKERYELVEGRVVMMTRPRRAHAIIISNLIVALHSLDLQKWTVIAEFGLEAGPKTLRFPDILVDRIGGSPDDRWATGPIFLAEVQSDSSTKTDLKDKATEFLRLPSLEAYAVFAQREPKAWTWLREAGGFPSLPRELLGQNNVIRLPGLGIELPLSEIYAGVTFVGPRQ